MQATVFYVMVYALMNLAAFAVIVARERETGLGDDLASMYGLGSERPWLAWPMTIAMLGLAGMPATAGFFGKIYLIDAAVDNDYGWLGVFDRDRLGDLAGVLPARGRGRLDALGVGDARAAHGADPGRPADDRRRVGGGRRRSPCAAPRRGRASSELVLVAVVCAAGHDRVRRVSRARCSTSRATPGRR